MSDVQGLLAKTCKPCEGGVPPLTDAQVAALMPALDPGWTRTGDGSAISRDFQFPGFGRTMQFVNAVAWIAGTEGHHPDLNVGYNTCRVLYTTHAIGGLSENDFICAAKIDRLVAG